VQIAGQQMAAGFEKRATGRSTQWLLLLCQVLKVLSGELNIVVVVVVAVVLL